MRLGVLLDRFDPAAGGAEAHTDALLRRALERGFSAALASLEGTPPSGVAHVAVPTARGRRPARDRAFARDGERALREAGCDRVLAIRHALSCDVYVPHGGLVQDAWDARDAARGGVPGLVRLARRFSAKRKFFLEAERALLGEDAGPVVLAVSRALAQRIGAVYPKAKRRIRVIHNGVDSDRFDPAPLRPRRGALRAELGISTGAYVGLLLAHEPWLKGLPTVLDAMGREEVVRLEPAFHLVVAGRRLDDARRLVDRLGLGARVTLVGAIADPRPLYAVADVLVQPTWYDPCSLVTLEALSMGLPVVTTPRNGVLELMGMRGGISVERPGCPESVAVAIRVLSDPALRAVTADDARYIARRNRLSTRLDQILDACVAPSAASAAPTLVEREDEGPLADPSLAGTP